MPVQFIGAAAATGTLTGIGAPEALAGVVGGLAAAYGLAVKPPVGVSVSVVLPVCPSGMLTTFGFAVMV